MRKVVKEGTKEYNSSKGQLAAIKIESTEVDGITVIPKTDGKPGKRKMKLVNLL